MEVSPVLYHGTVKYRVEQWRSEGGVRASSFSTTSFPLKTFFHASYLLAEVSGGGMKVRLRKGIATSFTVTFEQAVRLRLMHEFVKLAVGKVARSIALFDRDSLLELKHEGLRRCHDEFDGLQLEWRDNVPAEERVIPIETLIASLDVYPERGEAGIRVFSQRLWDENFDQPPPQVARMVPLGSDRPREFSYFQMFLLMGEVFGTEERFSDVMETFF